MHGVNMLFLFTMAIVFINCAKCEDGNTKQGQEQLLKFQFPLGFGSEQLLETDPATRNVYFNGTVTGDTAAVLIGGAGLLAVAAPALYVAYLSRSTGQSAVSIAKRYFRSLVSGTDYEGNIDYTDSFRARQNTDSVDKIIRMIIQGIEIYEDFM